MSVPRVLSGRYEVTRLLQAGRLARVHEGFDLHTRQPVAIEILDDAAAQDHAVGARFLEAGRVASELRHPNIAWVSEAAQSQGVWYVVRELVEGPSIREVVSRKGALEPGDAVAVATEVCDALTFAHRQGVVHGGLTPSQIVLTLDGDVRVLGFAVKDGTDPRYAPPEQTEGEMADARGDLYALGCCLYEMLVGGRAGDAAGAPRPDQVRPGAPGVPVDLSNVLRRLLAERPDERYQDAHTVRQTLAAYLPSGTDPADRLEEVARRTKEGDSGERAVGVAGERRTARHVRPQPTPDAVDDPDDPRFDALDRFRNPTIIIAVACLLLLGVIAISASRMLDLGSEQAVGSEGALGGEDVEIASPTSGGSTTVSGTDSSSEDDELLEIDLDEDGDDEIEEEEGEDEEADAEEGEEGEDDGDPAATTTTAPPATTTTSAPTTTTTEPVRTVPNVVGMHRDQAASTLSSQGLSMNVASRVCNNREIDNVLSQSPGAGAGHPDSGRVDVTVGRWCLLG